VRRNHARAHVRVENNDLAAAVNQLKRNTGKDIVVYGGASFVSSLIRAGLIDEFHFFVNPTAIGKGMQVFTARVPLKLVASTRYPSGIVVNGYTVFAG
jgi:dihydrofolate reductase